jgi:peptide/nickel transport system substrate-binding protein
VLLVLATLLSACGANQPASKSVLTVVPSPIGDFARNFNPFGSGTDYGTQGMIYETLLYFNSLDGTVHPWLASGYRYSADAKTVTFTLRQGVKWSDGLAFTADDVAFTFNLLKQFPAADTYGLWRYVQSVRETDSSTVVVNFKSAYLPILWYLAGQTYILPRHLWDSVGDPTTYTNPNPVGTGPYVLKSFTPQLIDLTRNPTFWQGEPAVQEIRYPSYDSDISTSLVLSTGSLDWAGLYTPGIQQTYVHRDSAHNHYWFPPHNDVMLYLNLSEAPFNQLAVRQAISDTIDRDRLDQVGEYGYEPVASPTGLVLPSGQRFLSPDYASSAFSVDAAKAKQLLQSAGFTRGTDGIDVDRTGKKLAFKLNVVTGWSDWVTDCQIIATELKEIGIDFTVNPMSFASYYSAFQVGNFDAAISWTNPGPTPYYLYNALLSSTGSANHERWSDPTTDALLDQYAGSLDQTAQQQALDGLQKIMVEQLPAIPLVYGATWYEYSTARFTGWPDASHPYAIPAPWSYPDNEIVVLHLKPAA